MASKAERIFDAIRNPNFQNITLGDGEFLGIPVEYILAEGEREEDDQTIALILTPATLKRLEKLEDELEDLRDDVGEDEDEGDDEDEQSSRPRRRGSAARQSGGRFSP